MTQVVHVPELSSCTSTTLQEWYYFDQGTPVNDMHICFYGQRIEWNHLSKDRVIPMLRIWKNPRWLPAKIILWQNHDVYIENQIIFANILSK